MNITSYCRLLNVIFTHVYYAAESVKLHVER